MAKLFTAGFDIYGGSNNVSSSIITMLTAGDWTAAGGGSTFSIVAGLSALGNALTIVTNSAIPLSKTLSANYSRLICGWRFSAPLTGGPVGVAFGDAGTVQCSVTINNTTGLISVRTGTVAGTAVGTSVSGVSANTTHTLVCDIAFGAAAAYQVWLDGVSILSGTGNTKVTANSFANQLILAGAAAGGTMTWDDLYLLDTTGGAPLNAAILTSPRVETQAVTSDSAVQFGFGAAILGAASQRVQSTAAPGANRLFIRQFTPPVNCTLVSVSCVPAATSAGAKFKAVAFADSAGAAGSLLSSGTEVVGATSGTTLTSALVSSQALTAGTPYWIGFITDTSVLLQEVDATATGYSAANTYASGAPNPAPAMTSAQPSWIIYGNLTGVAPNWFEVYVNQPVGDLSFVFDATVGHEDLYNFAALVTVPATIYGMTVKSNMKRTDVGARTVSLRTKSSGTDSGGTVTGQTPGTSYAWLSSGFDTDPNTAAAWTPANLNAATSGFKIDS